MFIRIATPLSTLAVIAGLSAHGDVAAHNLEGPDDSAIDTIMVIGQRSGAGISDSDAVTTRMSQSSVALTRDVLDDYGVHRLADALELVSGISQQNNLGGLRDNYAIRGFLGTPDTGAEYLVDGFYANRGFGPPRDPANAERIDILKGPAGAVFGSADPAGIVNIVTKKPHFHDALQATFSAGSFDTRRAEIDGEYVLAPSVSTRLVGAVEDSNGWRDHVDLSRRLFAPSISWRANAATTVTYQAEYIRFKAPFDRGIVAVGNDAEALPVERFLGEPDDGDVESENWRHQLTFEHQLGEGWSILGGAAYRDASLSGYSSESSALQADGTLWRQRRLRDWDMTDLSGRIELRGVVEAFGSHMPSIGVTAYDLDFDMVQERFRPSAQNPYAIDIYNPVYGAEPGALTPNSFTTEKRKSYATYVQDMWELTERLSFVGGIRYDHVDQELTNRRSGVVSPIKRDPVDYRVGTRFRISDHLAVHANWGEGFRANSSTGRNDNAFDPETGEGYEIGAKLAADRVRGAISWFRVTKENVLATDPVDVNYLATVGRVISKGIEIDGEVELTQSLRMVANYSYTDAHSSDPSLATSDVLNVPEHTGTLQLMATVPVAERALDLTFGGTYVGSRAAALDGGTLRLDDYVKLKASATYAISPRIDARLEVDNLLDETYAQSSYSALWIYPGAPRTILGSLTIRY